MQIRFVSINACVALVTCLLGAYASADIPRMDDGKPDLSGTYDITSLTPFTRNRSFGEKMEFTAEEVEELKSTAHSRVDAAAAAIDPSRGPLEALEGDAKTRGVDNSGSYTPGSHDYFWFDCGGQYCDLYQLGGKYRTSIVVDPPNGQLPQVSDAGKARRATLLPYYKAKYPGEAYWLEEGGDPYGNPEDMSLGDRCLYMGLTVPARPSAYNNMKTIVQSDDHVLIMVEWMHWPRVIRLNSTHVPQDMGSLGGDSIGWWEGDTLVVETTNFLTYPDVPREGLRIVERFSAIDEGSLLYNFTVHDSDYVAPYTGEFPWTKSDKRLYEYACHEGNYSMANTLRGARVLERKWIEKNGPPSGR